MLPWTVADIVDEQESIFVGIDVLSVTAFDVDRGGVVHVERQAGRNAPGLLQIVVEINTGRNTRDGIEHKVVAHRPRGGELVHPPRGKALGVLRTSREGRDVGEIDVGAAADHPPETMIVIVLVVEGIAVDVADAARNDELMTAGDIILRNEPKPGISVSLASSGRSIATAQLRGPS